MKWFSDRVFRWTDVASVVVVTASLLSAYATNPSLTWTTDLLLLGLSVVYVLLGTVGFTSLVMGNSNKIFLYFAVQIVLVTAIVYFSRGGAGLAIVMVAAEAGWLSWQYSVALSVILITMVMAVYQITFEDWSNTTQAFFNYGSALIFVLIFIRVLGRAERTNMENERLAAELREANNKLREYSVQAEELATTKERNRMAREIHDSLGHYFTVVNVQIEAARAVMDTDPQRSREALQKAQSLTKEGLNEVRRSISTLRVSPLEKQSLVEALHGLAEENRNAGIVTELYLQGDPVPLEAPVELTLYRVVQEGLTNIRKHACASKADVRLDYRVPKWVSLIIEDNGIGKTTSSDSPGFGLIGMRERINLLNGTFEVESAMGQGFTVRVELPV